MDASLIAQAHSYALTGGGAGMITRHGLLVDSWGNLHTQYELKSATKSVGSILMGIAIDQGLMTLSATGRTYFPALGNPPSENEATGWCALVTIRQMANHSAGFGDDGDFQPFLFQPGTRWSYSSCGINWLGDVLTLRYNDDLRNVLATRVMNVVGAQSADWTWRSNAYRPPTLNGLPRRETASGISASVDAIARLGYMCLRGGHWNSNTILSTSYINQMRVPDASIASLPNQDPSRYPNATHHYGLSWWNNGDGSISGCPTDAYWAWGLGEALIVVIPSLDIVAARLGDGWQSSDWGSNYNVVSPFIGPIARSVNGPLAADDPEHMSWARLRAQYR